MAHKRRAERWYGFVAVAALLLGGEIGPLVGPDQALAATATAAHSHAPTNVVHVGIQSATDLTSTATAATPTKASRMLAPSTETYKSAVLADKPLIYYRLNESAGPTAIDSSGNGQNGTYASSGITYGAGGAILGDTDPAITDNGVAAVTQPGSTLPSTAPLSAEIWAKTSTTSDAVLWAFGSGVPSDTSFRIHYGPIGGGNNPPLWVFDANGGQVSQGALPRNVFDNNWHQFVLTIDSSGNLAVYLDGAIIGSGSIAWSTAIPGSGLALGSDNGGGGAFTGSLDEFSIYNVALTAEQVSTHWTLGQSHAGTPCGILQNTPYSNAVRANSPLVYYPLDDLSGDLAGRVAFDQSGNCRNGSYAPGLAPTSRGVSVPGTGGSIIANSQTLPGAPPVSVEIWIRTTSNGTAWAYGSTAPYDIDLRLVSGNPGIWVLNVDGGQALHGTLPGNTFDGNWHQLVFTQDASNTVVYVDAVATTIIFCDRTCIPHWSEPIPGDGLELGNSNLNVSGNGTVPLAGDLGDFSIYNSMLSASDVAAHYNAATNPFLPLTPQQLPTDSNASIPQSCTCQDHQGSPINTASGAFYHTFTDFSIPGRGIPLNLTRTYSSVFAAQNGPLGYGWTDSYNMSLSRDSVTGDVTISQENGAQVAFTPVSGGYTAPPRVAATLSVDSSTSDYLFRRDAQNLYTFSPSGQLIKETDRNGYVTSLVYNLTGQLATVTEPAGRKLSFTWTGGHITAVTDPLGRKVTFTYDAPGNLASAADPVANLTNFTYDSSHHVLSMIDPRGGVVTNTYNAQGRVTSQSDPMGRTTSFAYSGDNQSAAGGTTTITDSKGNVTLENYQDGLLMSATYGSGTTSAAIWTYQRDPATLGITQISDPNGHITTKSYDASGNLLTQTRPGSRTTTYTYNPINEPLTVTDPLGVTTTMTYDAAGNLLSRTTPLGASLFAVTRYAYADTAHPGEVTSITNPNGKVTTYTYDANGDRTAVTDPLGDKTSIAYNVDGWPVAVTDPKGKVTKITYDTRGQPISNTDPLGHVSTYGYDANGNLTTITDPQGHTTTTAYDKDNEATVVTRADATTQGSGYDADGNVISQTNALGNVITYTYDPLNHLASMTDPLSRTTSYRHDGLGNLLSTTLPDGQVTTDGYDADNELVSISYSDGKTHNVTMTYDAAGRRVQMTDGTGTSSWTWDALDRMTSSKFGAGATVTYGYDLDGNQTNIAYPAGTVTRSYDAADRLINVKDWLGNVIKFAYDKDGDLTSETFPSTTKLADTFSYDSADQLSGITDKHGTTTIASFGYSRNADGLVTSEKNTAVPPPTTSRYGYNPINELTTDNSTSYAYDAADNITRLINGSSLSYDAAQQLGSLTNGSSTTTYSYDTQGNRLSAKPSSGIAASYAWDQANRLVADSSGTTSSSYAYDGDGLRMGKTVGTTTQSFLWDESGPLSLILSDGTNDYIYGVAGLPIEQITGLTVTDYHHDQLGSTRLLTNRTGAKVATYTYDAYGNLTGTGTVTTPLRYSGQYQDSESQLYYLHARYYDPTTAQFLTVDPAVGITTAPYAYVAGNPLNANDPTGLDCSLNPLDWGSCVSNAWNATGGGLVNTIQNGGLPNGHCIVGIQRNCQSDVVGNVEAIHNTPIVGHGIPVIGGLYKLDPFVGLYIDKARQLNGDCVSDSEIQGDILGAFLIPGGSALGQLPARIAGPGLGNWATAAWLWNQRTPTGFGLTHLLKHLLGY